MKGFVIGATTAAILVALTYVGLQYGAVTTKARYSAPTVKFDVPQDQRMTEE